LVAKFIGLGQKKKLARPLNFCQKSALNLAR
jgi:hypothetical protein